MNDRIVCHHKDENGDEDREDHSDKFRDYFTIEKLAVIDQLPSSFLLHRTASLIVDVVPQPLVLFY